MLNDLRVLIKDLDDIQRIKVTQSKRSLIKWSDLPSQANKPKPEMDPNVRIAFLQDLTKKYAEKNK